MKKILTLSLLGLFSSAVLADNVIVTETKSWKSVPIVVDSANQVYTIETTATPVEGDYYYSYSGYRCFKDRRDVAGVTPVVLRSKTTGGVDIYCYPE